MELSDTTTMIDPKQTNHERPTPRTAMELIRAAADGEVLPGTPESSALEQLRAADPDLETKLAFERSLREAVARAAEMDPSIRAPQDLRDSILDAIRNEPIPFSAARPANRWWPLAVAAALALATGLVFYISNATSTWYAPGSSSSSATLASALSPERVSSLVNFTNKEHDNCANFGEVFEKKMTTRCQTEATKNCQSLIHKIPSVLDLGSTAMVDAGYTFAGMGTCAVPGKGRSAHLIYKPDPAKRPDGPAVSLFIQEDAGDLPIEPNITYTSKGCKLKELSDCRCILRVWRKDGLIYYLVAPPSLCKEADKAFNPPAREKTLL